MVFCFIIHQGRMNRTRGKGHGGHTDTVRVTAVAAARHDDCNLSAFV